MNILLVEIATQHRDLTTFGLQKCGNDGDTAFDL
jgi:hypothetical protein